MTSPHQSIWRDMLAYLRRFHSEICRQWFEELEPLALDGGVMVIRVRDNPIQLNYLRGKCISQFNEAAQSATGALVAVSFVDGHTALPPIARGAGDNGSAGHQPERAAPPTWAADRPGAAARYGAAAGDDLIELSPDYTFENFITGPGNRLAAAAAVAVAEKPGYAYNPLFIHGGVGLGKTHLLQAICHTILAADPHANICYLSCDSFMNQFLESVRRGEMASFQNRYRHVDMLIIDDIHFLANRERAQEEFFHTFNALYQVRKQIVLSSESPPNEIPQLEERLVSRFNWGLVARVEKPCFETRVAILQQKARIRGIDISNDVLCYIAAEIDSNTRELEGAITKIQGMAMVNERPIDLALAQEAIGKTPGGNGESQLTIQTIIDAVTQFYGVKLSDLQSKRRHRSITMPRQVCMYLARKRTRYSLEEIGGYFGGRDHTTVMHAVKIVTDRLSDDHAFARQVEQIDQSLSASDD